MLAAEQWQDESTVDGEDRVELFFAGAPVDRPGEDGMERYYAIEVDPKGRVHDYSIAYYRQFDGDWSLAGLETKAALTDDGYSVEGKIPLKTLQELHLLRDGLMRTGVFRAEFSPSSGTEPRMEWISWVNPNTPQPDFHVSHAKHVALNLFLSSACTKRFIKITQNHILQNQSSDNHAAKQTFSLTTLRFS